MSIESKTPTTPGWFAPFFARWLAGFVCVAGLLLAASSTAHAETRTLKLYFLHTKERASITYYRNGRYLPSGLRKVNRFLRDWRRNEPTKMDPRLLDAVWEAYRKSGSRDYIHVISGYRSPKTNSMLRKRGRGVARKSQHMLGRALDFYLPDVKLSKLRNIGLRMQRGGVGYYPRSGSPFVHFDVGRVRHWPRMNRRQLVSVFPNGRTLHVPTDGKPLPGYKQALAAYERRKKGGSRIQLARNEPTPTPRRAPARENDRGFLTTLFTGADEEEENSTATQPAAQAAAPTPPEPVATEREEPAPVVVAEAGPSLPEGNDAPLPQPAPRPVVVALAEPKPEPEPKPAIEEPESIPFQVVAAAPEPEQPSVDMPVPAFRPTPPRAEQAVAEAPVTTQTELPAATMTLAALQRPDPVVKAESILNDLRLRRPAETVGIIPVSAPATPASVAPEPVTTASNPEPVIVMIAPEPAPATIVSAPTPAAPEAPEATEEPIITKLLPVPTPAKRPADTRREILLAALQQTNRRPVTDALEQPVVVLPSDRPVVETKRARVPFKTSEPASQRFALLSAAPDIPPELALATGVKTAPKNAKPELGDQPPAPKSVVIPVKFASNRTTHWALSSYAARTKQPETNLVAFFRSVEITAPTAVYTNGFQRERLVADVNRFSGQAVRFLSVARFASN